MDTIYRTLGEVAIYVNGRAFKPTEWESTGLPIIRIQNLTDNNAKFNYSSAAHEEKYLIHHGDLLFAWSASLGAHIWRGKDAWLNQHIFHVIPNENIDKMYLYYFLCQVVAELYGKTHGSGMVHITKAPFMATRIPVPSLDEQQRIVARIEELFSELDNGVETLQKTKQQLAVYRQAVYNSVFTDDLPMHVITEYFDISGGLTKNSKRNELAIKMPYLRVANVYYNQLDLSEIKYIGVTEAEIDRCTIAANGLGNAELILLNVRPPKTCQFCQPHSCSENEVQGPARGVVRQGFDEPSLFIKSEEANFLLLHLRQNGSVCWIVSQDAIHNCLFKCQMHDGVSLPHSRWSFPFCNKSINDCLHLFSSQCLKLFGTNVGLQMPNNC